MSPSSIVDQNLSLANRLRGIFAVIFAYVALRCLPLSMIGKIFELAKRYFSCREISLEEADIAWRAVRQSNFFFLGRVACLELSLAFVLFALTKGLSAKWCMGVKTLPFQSHAWVEIGGKPFGEPDFVERELKKLFVI